MSALAPLNLESLFVDALASKVVEAVIRQLAEHPVQVQPRLMDIDAAAKYLGRSPSAVRHLIDDKKIVPVRIDSRVQIDRLDLDSLIERAKVS